MLPIVLKAVHVLSSMLFLGLGLGSVFYKVRAYRRGELAVVAFCDREIVLADWLFTVPSGIVLPVTGLWLATLYQLPLTTPWILAGLGGWAFAGLTWLPAASPDPHAHPLRARRSDRRGAPAGVPPRAPRLDGPRPPVVRGRDGRALGHDRQARRVLIAAPSPRRSRQLFLSTTRIRLSCATDAASKPSCV
ncbi:MAG: DUF2269 domain-containing protein [Sandaracinaceae bacterium]|nr:DUF2269 domain-containing protein [Sandaracinaceae bacterium]